MAFQWFQVMLSMSTLFASCYIQNVTATFDMFFVDICFAFCFMQIKFSEIRAFGFLHFYIPLRKGFKLTPRLSSCFQTGYLQAVNRWAALTGEGFGGLICLHPYPYESGMN